jgi:hypothetical protein
MGMGTSMCNYPKKMDMCACASTGTFVRFLRRIK